MDDNPNAFINEKKLLFITTGLIKYCPSYEAFMGVLAHEIGHLKNYHISKRMESIKNMKSFSNIGTLSIIASSILANNSDNLIQPIIMNQVGIQNYYSAFSRDQEREADIYAIKILNKLKISSKPLKKFLEILEYQNLKKTNTQENIVFSTHPIYEERFEIIDNITINSDFIRDENLNIRFNFIKAKIFGFTEKNDSNFIAYLQEDYYDYAKSIILSREGKLKKSLSILNRLIEKYPSNLYLIETKADLLFNHGYANISNDFYKLILKKNNNNYYVKKRIFEIEFEEIKKTKKIKENFFNSFSDLILVFYSDKILQKKFRELCVAEEKKEWLNLVDANIYLNNRSAEEVLKILNNIILKSKDKKIVNFAKKIVRDIS